MILRRRHPDGSDSSLDLGPGPVGRMPTLGGVIVVGQSTKYRPERTEYQREWMNAKRKRQRAEARARKLEGVTA